MASAEDLSPIKRALLELREMRSQLDDLEGQQKEPIAVVGMGMRFPGGANNPRAFWHLLREGVDAITEVPPERWSMDAFYDPDPMKPGKMSTRYGGFLTDIDRFDPHFFGIAPREAASMDPQQRLLLEITWEALENAGQAPDKLFGSLTGVFLGISNSDYFRMLVRDIRQIDTYASTGNAYSVAAGRLSYILGLQGPNIALDTACSGSLVATHLAVQSLRQKECHLALVGGVNLILTPEITVNFSKAQMMADDGRCKTFDAAADGYVRSEGCGVVVLKRLSDALADNDHIMAVIRGTAINQDGRSGGLTAPNGPSQEQVIAKALELAGVEPHEVSYVETHGTGTSLGDPIEVGALAAVYGQDRNPDEPLMIGSVKTNIGHTEAAAGIAGLMKAVLALQHQQIPPHLHLKELNPYIPWDQYPVTVPTALTPWTVREGRRIAGVSSFGFSGTNAHAILEEAPEPEPVDAVDERSHHILPLSARTEAALSALVGQYLEYLDSETAQANFTDVCFTAGAGRSHFSHRLAVVANSAAEACDKLVAFASGDSPVGLFSGQVQGMDSAEVAFLFTGHGAQYIDMGRVLYETQPIFREALDRCDQLLRSYMDQPLLAVLYPEPGTPSLMDGMTYTQPALFAIQYALAELWRSWGIQPTMVAGHSVGEYAAAHVAGIFSLEDGLKLVAARGRLMDALPETGQMVAVFADEARVAAAVAPYADRVAVAVINGPQNIVISGAEAEVTAVVETLKAEGIKSRRLAVAQASHSPLIDPLLDEFEQIAATVEYFPPQIELVSSMTGQVVKPSEVTRTSYWRQHIRQPVRFSSAVETLYSQGSRVFIEIGPNPTLIAIGQRCLPDNEAVWLPSLREGWDDWQQILESVAGLYVTGTTVDWETFHDPYPHRKLPLPTYPFQRARYWTDVTSTPPQPEVPVWKAVTAAGQKQAHQGPLELALGTYADRWDCLHRLTVAYVGSALGTLGVFAQPGESHTVDTLIAQCGILPVYHDLMGRWLRKLADAGLLQQQEETFVSVQPIAALPVDDLLDEARRLMPDSPYIVDYMERCGTHLPAVITGAMSGLETLFPDGAFGFAEDLYQHWAMSRYYIYIMREVAASLARTLPATRPITVLEIGAGTGATTSSILPVLPPERTTYHFTDVSNLFLAHAAEKFADYPFVRYGLLNIENDPAEQGYPPQSFDLIIATNVLHATRDLDATLAHVHALLRPGGLLLMDEVTEHLSWFDITTGLIEGWQRYFDHWREDNPLLKPEQWKNALHAHSFESVAAWPEPGAPAEILGQHIILAQVPEAAFAEQFDVVTGQAGADFSPSPEDAAAAENPADLFRAQLQEVLPDERHELLVDYVRHYLARVLRVGDDHPLDRQQRLLDMGLDSLMALELRALLGSGLGLTEALPATLVFDYPSIEAVAGYLDQVVMAGPQEEAPPVVTIRPEETPSARTSEIADLSDEEVEILLMQKLKRQGQ